MILKVILAIWLVSAILNQIKLFFSMENEIKQWKEESNGFLNDKFIKAAIITLSIVLAPLWLIQSFYV